MQNHAKSNQFTISRAQKQNILFAFIAFLCLAIALGAGWLFLKPNSDGIPKVLSLKENWDSLEKEARDWQDDAYLTEVIFFRINKFSALQIRAEFHSSHVLNQEMLSVEIDNSGMLKASPINLALNDTKNPQTSVRAGASFVLTKPIDKKDWSIDSQDALNIFAKDGQIHSCLQSSQEIELSISRFYTETPAWHLIIINCPNNNGFNDYFIDANTGRAFEPFFNTITLRPQANTACTGQVRARPALPGKRPQEADSASGGFVRQFPPLPVTPAVRCLLPKKGTYHG